MNDVHECQVCFAAPRHVSSEVEAVCITAAGGVTLLSAQGVWESDSGEVVREPVIVGLVSVRNRNSVERLRLMLRSLLENCGERCMWFTVQPISGGLFALEDPRVGDERKKGGQGSMRAAG